MMINKQLWKKIQVQELFIQSQRLSNARIWLEMGDQLVNIGVL